MDRRIASLDAEIAAVLKGSAWAESLADTLVGAYRHSALLDQNRAVLRAAPAPVEGAE